MTCTNSILLRHTLKHLNIPHQENANDKNHQYLTHHVTPPEIPYSLLNIYASHIQNISNTLEYDDASKLQGHVPIFHKQEYIGYTKYKIR